MRARTSHSRRDIRDPWQMPKTRDPEPVARRGAAAPMPRGVSSPRARCSTGEETSTCFSVFPVLHNHYFLLF